jgi:ankyrin repeat protein/predicted RNA-binding Zn-ribbon protein involved in translation (DUF1610 family)
MFCCAVATGANPNAKTVEGLTPLTMAIGFGHEEIAILLLQHLLLCAGFDIDQALAGFPRGEPLLAAAASKGMCDLIELALDNGALVNATGEYGSAASQAASRGHLQALNLLYQRGADLALGCGLANAAGLGHVHIVRRLLKLGVHVNSMNAQQTLSALMLAAIAGQRAAAEVLLAAGAAMPLHQQNLLLGSVCEKLDDAPAAQMLKLLLPRCGNYEAQPRDSGDTTPFVHAVGAGKLQAAQLLGRAGADVVYTDALGRNAVHAAACTSSLEMVQWVVSLGVDPRARDGNGSLPLHAACAQASAHADIVQCLLSVPGAAADVRAADKDGLTPLHVAASSDSEAVVKLLLQRGADVTAAAADGSTPLIYAGAAPVVKLLLAAGADATAVDRNGCSVLHYSAKSCAAAGAVCLLLKAGADPTATAINGATAADLADFMGHTALQSLLLRAADDYRKAHPVTAKAVNHGAVDRSSSTGTATAASDSTAVAAAAAATAADRGESSCSSSELKSAESSSSSTSAAAAGSSDSSTDNADQPAAAATSSAGTEHVGTVLQQQQQQQTPAAKKAKQPCANCGSIERTKRCRACAAVYYCSVECQKVCFRDASHKAECEAKAALLT